MDEYNKPILDTLHDSGLATANRDLRGFHGIMKDSVRYVSFVFVTGMSMFPKVSLLSGFNNLEDINLDLRLGPRLFGRRLRLGLRAGVCRVGLGRDRNLVQLAGLGASVQSLWCFPAALDARIPYLPVPNADGEIRESDGIGNRLADMPRLSKFDLAEYLGRDAGCG